MIWLIVIKNSNHKSFICKIHPSTHLKSTGNSNKNLSNKSLSMKVSKIKLIINLLSYKLKIKLILNLLIIKTNYPSWSSKFIVKQVSYLLKIIYYNLKSIKPKHKLKQISHSNSMPKVILLNSNKPTKSYWIKWNNTVSRTNKSKIYSLKKCKLLIFLRNSFTKNINLNKSLKYAIKTPPY